MIEVRLQRSYNWAFGSVSNLTRFLPYVAKGSAKTQETGKVLQVLRRIDDQVIRDASTQFRLIFDATGYRCMKSASDDLLAVAKRLRFATDKAKQDASLTEEIAAIQADLIEIRDRLKRESPIRYRAWFVNPFRHYPKKLA